MIYFEERIKVSEPTTPRLTKVFTAYQNYNINLILYSICFLNFTFSIDYPITQMKKLDMSLTMH